MISSTARQTRGSTRQIDNRAAAAGRASVDCCIDKSSSAPPDHSAAGNSIPPGPADSGTSLNQPAHQYYPGLPEQPQTKPAENVPNLPRRPVSRLDCPTIPSPYCQSLSAGNPSPAMD